MTAISTTTAGMLVQDLVSRIKAESETLQRAADTHRVDRRRCRMSLEEKRASRDRLGALVIQLQAECPRGSWRALLCDAGVSIRSLERYARHVRRQIMVREAEEHAQAILNRADNAMYAISQGRIAGVVVIQWFSSLCDWIDRYDWDMNKALLATDRTVAWFVIQVRVAAQTDDPQDFLTSLSRIHEEVLVLDVDRLNGYSLLQLPALPERPPGWNRNAPKFVLVTLDDIRAELEMIKVSKG